MDEQDARALEQVVAAVRQSAKYRQVSAEFVQALGRRELAARRNVKEATKATKNRLHQVCGAFNVGEARYDAWLAEIGAAVKEGGSTAVRAACRRIMRQHASSRERLPILDRFHAEALAGLPHPRSVLDLGCGLHPLSMPWMALGPEVRYRCCDVDAGLVGFLNEFFRLAGSDGQAEVRDVVTSPPTEPADLVLLLKLLPTLDRIERDAGRMLLRSLSAPHLLVSFPARSLGGHEKGMARQYEGRFLAMAAEEGWQTTRIGFPGELVFLVAKT